MEQAIPRPAEATVDRQKVALLIGTVGGHAVKHMFNSAFFLLLPEIKAGLGMSNAQVGSLSTLRNIASGLCNVPAGFAADRFAHRRAEILGLCLAGIGVFALVLGLATTYWVAVLGAVLMSMSISFWHPAAISWLSRQFASRRGFAIALHGTGGSVGEAVGPLLAGALVSVLSWRTVMQGSIVPAVLLGAGVWLALRSVAMGEVSSAGVKSYLRSARGTLANRRLLLILVFAGGFSGGQSIVLTFLPIYLREDIGVSSMTLGLYMAMAQVAGIGSQPLMGYLSDRLGRKAVLTPGLAALGLALLGVNLSPSGWPLVLVVLAMGAFLFPMMSILLASAMDVVDTGVQATTVSFVFGASVIMSSFAPGAAGVVADAYGVKAAFLCGSGLVLAAALLSAISRWQKRATSEIAG